MCSSRGFASTATNSLARFGLAFASAPPQSGLTSLMTVSRRIIMQKARRHPGIAAVGLRPLVGVWFQVHCPPLVGVLPIIRSRYWFAIGRQGVLSLAGWTPQIRAGFHVSGPTQVPNRNRSPVAYGTVTRCGGTFQSTSARVLSSLRLVLQPRPGMPGRFRLFRVRSPLLTESRFLSLPRGNEMFQFPRFAACAYGFSTRQFRDPGLNARLTAPPGLSQSSTPFIASWRQDIPHMPLVAWPH
jgi:hypothetical protein